MELRYYQYRLGEAILIGGEMHASLHEIKLDNFKNTNPFFNQIFNCLTSEENSLIIRKHIERGINLSDKKHTRLIAAPDFPLKSFEPGYFTSKQIKLGLSGGDFCSYEPNLLVETYYFFWETKHPFSQWHKCKFNVDGQNFSSTEQYMMYGKAILFSDFEIAEQILNTKNVREQKNLGRLVKGFEKNIWDLNAPTIVYKGNKEKFKQNIEFKKLLMSTNGKTIVEASPDDNIWGIGLTAQEKDSEQIVTWKGTNWLGIVLTELREELLGNTFGNGYLTLENFKSKMI